ncbi:MAG: Frataxin family protein [Gallionellaceae bacterium]|nr:MAG: Frataxin family protein [Gallionellaceae bacterium]
MSHTLSSSFSAADYMTENTHPDLAGALFDHIESMVRERDAHIGEDRNGNALRLEFADGQRIVINIDSHAGKVWLASRAGGTEFELKNGAWCAHDQSELLQRLSALIEQAIASNPINARAGRAPKQRADAPSFLDKEPNKSHGLRNLLILAFAVLAGFWLAQRPSQPATANKENASTNLQHMTAGAANGTRECEASLPANGSINIFSNGLRADGPNDAEVTLKNDHAYPLLLILAEPRTVIPSLSVLVYARQTTTFHLPAGQYDMLFGVGNAWCDPHSGFSDGHLMKFDKSLTVQMDKPMQLAMQSSGADMGDFQLFVKTLVTEAPLPPPTFTGDGSMVVQRQSNGHFYLPGTVANVPVTFMVDTGASVTSISSDIARQAGIHNCKEVQFQTANGTATGCIALVPSMTLGNFVLQNITVAVMPNMETNLLGANVLRNFQVSQSDSMMLIGRR